MKTVLSELCNNFSFVYIIVLFCVQVDAAFILCVVLVECTSLRKRYHRA
jgi:hypothetical protein